MTDNQNSLPIKFNLNAHYSEKTKLEAPKLKVAQPLVNLPDVHLFSDNDANQKMKTINNDIYVRTKKEKLNNEFNKSLYLKIFAIITLAIASIAGFSKIKNFFRKS